MSAKHTPGPWKLVLRNKNREFDEAAVRQDIPGNQRTLARVLTRCPEAEANARLIATAPEMLAELKFLVRWYDQLNPVDIQRAKTLITKATEPTP